MKRIIPRREIEKAIKLKEDYKNEKKRGNI